MWNALKIEFSSTWFSTTKESFRMGRAAIEDEPYYLLLSLSLHPIFHSFLIFTYMTKAKGFLSSFHLPLHQMQKLYFSSQILCFAYVQKNSEIKHRWLAGLRWWVLCNDGDCICDYDCNHHAHCNNHIQTWEEVPDYKWRTIQRSKPDAEFRVLVCVHTHLNVPTINNLLEASHPTKRSPMCVYVVHLVELTGRASAMLIIHSTRKSGRPALNDTQAQSDNIINAFENYE